MINEIWGPTKHIFTFPKKISARDVNNFFERKFEGGRPVLVSSGRAAISLILQNFHKSSNIQLFPYASQCVVNARYSAGKSPYTALNKEQKTIVFHQWGYKISAIVSRPLIEDAVDTFYPIGTRVL
jgi:putative PLP-dependent aminotransferase (TIGR04422 family)